MYEIAAADPFIHAYILGGSDQLIRRRDSQKSFHRVDDRGKISGRLWILPLDFVFFLHAALGQPRPI